MKKTIYTLGLFGMLSTQAIAQCNPVFPTSLSASSSTACGNGIVTLNATGGSPSLGGGTTWQWINVTGANCLTGSGFGPANNFVPTNVSSPQIVGGVNQFKLKVTGGTCGSTGQCSAITVNVTGIASANVTVPPTKLFCPGFSNNLTATVSGATSMQWLKNNVVVPGATLSTLSFTNPILTDAGNYQLATSSACGNATSAAVTFTTISSQPILGANSTLVGSSNTLSVTSNASLSYSWSIAGSGTITSITNSSSMTVNSSATAGVYTVTLVSSINTCSVADTKTVSVTAAPPATWLKYSFNTGTPANDLGTNNTGTLSAGTLTTDRFGNSNQAYNEASINCGSVPAYANATELTVAGWFKKPALASDFAMFSFGNFYSRVYQGGSGFQNAPFSYNQSSKYTTPTVGTYTNMAVGTWFHYAHVISATNGGNLVAYINGTLVGASDGNSTNVGAPAIGGLPFILGAPFSGNSQWPAAYDDIFVVNKALSAIQIDSLKNLPNPGQLNTTNIKSLSSKSILFSIYPNPANDVITVIAESTLKLEIMTVLGTVVNASETNQQISISHLASGIYYVTVGDGVNRKSQKFIKQ
jgi:hypothetical protein